MGPKPQDSPPAANLKGGVLSMNAKLKQLVALHNWCAIPPGMYIKCGTINGENKIAFAIRTAREIHFLEIVFWVSVICAVLGTPFTYLYEQYPSMLPEFIAIPFVVMFVVSITVAGVSRLRSWPFINMTEYQNATYIATDILLFLDWCEEIGLNNVSSHEVAALQHDAEAILAEQAANLHESREREAAATDKVQKTVASDEANESWKMFEQRHNVLSRFCLVSNDWQKYVDSGKPVVEKRKREKTLAQQTSAKTEIPLPA